MKVCQISTLLAYLSSIYILSSIFYLITTRHLGTPFKNAVSKYPELVKIKKTAVHQRKYAFYSGIVISSIFLFIFNPFGECF